MEKRRIRAASITVLFLFLINQPVLLRGEILSVTQPVEFSSSAQDVVVHLDADSRIKREIAGGEIDSYDVMAGAEQYLRIKVNQQGTNLALKLLSPTGQIIAEVREFYLGVTYKSISAITREAGSYRLEITPIDQKAERGSYEVSIDSLKAASEGDLKRHRAETLFAEAEQLRAKRKADDLKNAVKKYEEAVPLFIEIGDRRAEANALMNAGIVYVSLSDYQKALDCFNRAAPAFKAIGDRRSEAGTLNNTASLYYFQGDTSKALEGAQQSLAIYREIGDRAAAAEVISNIGSIHMREGDSRKAIEYFDEALTIIRSNSNKNYEPSILSRLGDAYDDLGEPQKSLEYYNQALTLRRKRQDKRGQAITLANLSSLYRNQGELYRALDYLKQSLEILREAGNRQGEAGALYNIGLVYSQLGDTTKALEYYEQSIAISREINDTIAQANCLNSMAVNFLTMGEAQKALDYHKRALELLHPSRDIRAEARTLLRLGRVYESMNNLKEAINLYNQGLEKLRTISDKSWEATSLASLGSASFLSGDSEKALKYYEQSLAIRRSLGERPGEVDSLYGIALVKLRDGRLEEARAAIESAIDITEFLRGRIVLQDLQTMYFSSKRGLYDLQIDVLMQLHAKYPGEKYNEAALRASERARARSLLDILAEAQVNINNGADPLLVERQKEIQQQINAKDMYRMRLLSRQHTESQIQSAERELEELISRLQEVRAQIRLRGPRYDALTHPPIVSLSDIQQKILDDQTLLIEYSLGEQRSYLWAVTTDSISSYVLPGREEIQAVSKRVYELLTARNIDVEGETVRQKLERVKAADEAFHNEAARLSRMIIPAGVSLAEKKRLLIVAEGVLQYIPFAALPVPGKESFRPLILDHEIVNLPSASVLGILRQQRSEARPSQKTIAIFADPVFSEEDPRLKQATAKGKASDLHSERRQVSPVRATQESGLTSFRRLRFSRQEAETIAQMVEDKDILKAVDFEANKLAIVGHDLSSYRIIHFATHTLLNSTTPELSGIVLSLVDEQGNSQDGFLRMHEIYNLNLGGEMVVLSGCQTALGREIKGEGLIGLTRGFMYAGAARVVASLWSVDDKETAYLMKRFYKYLLKDGMRPAAALRTAQIEAIKGNRQQEFYWASFALQGEWR